MYRNFALMETLQDKNVFFDDFLGKIVGNQQSNANSALLKKIYEKKKQKLGLDTLRPWDTEAEPAGVEPLRPFNTAQELIDKSIACFTELNPFFGDCLKKMQPWDKMRPKVLL